MIDRRLGCDGRDVFGTSQPSLRVQGETQLRIVSVTMCKDTKPHLDLLYRMASQQMLI